jgi:hypothetical protein
MNPVEHFFAGWAVANVLPLERRGRMLVTLAGVIPDLDGFGILPELLTRGTKHELLWWTDYHHLLGHNLGFALFCTAGTIFVARRRILTPLLVALSFHLHLLCDVIGARGPDGYQWPIPYLLPFSNAWQWTWSGQWTLNAWQNVVIMIGLLLFAGWVAVRRGRTPVEVLSARGDAAVVAALRGRIDRHRTE